MHETGNTVEKYRKYREGGCGGWGGWRGFKTRYMLLSKTQEILVNEMDTIESKMQKMLIKKIKKISVSRTWEY